MANQYSYERGSRAVSLNAATGTGAGDSFGFLPFLGGGIPGTYSWDIIITGGPSAVTVNLEGSDDGTNWFTVDTSTSTSSALRHVVDKPVRFLRANLATLTGGSSPTVSVGISA
jgi:methyl coenzyme M reductase beta subunit